MHLSPTTTIGEEPGEEDQAVVAEGDLSNNSRQRKGGKTPEEAGNRAPGRGGQAGQRRERRQPLAPFPGLLAPRALAQTSTAEKNDPAYLTEAILIEGTIGFIQRTRNRDFQVDFSAYLSLIEASYDAQTTKDSGLAKHVSRSMYTYYCIILLWDRLYEILSSRGIFLLESQRIKALLGAEIEIPTDIGVYLASLGDITDPSGRQARLTLAGELLLQAAAGGAHGSFGRVGAANHILYGQLQSSRYCASGMISPIR